LMTIASFAVTGYLIFKHHLAPEALDYHNAEYSYWAYSKPYTRIPVYFVGVAAAWILIQMEERGITTRTGWVGNGMATFLWWAALIILTFITLIVFCDHGNFRNSWSDMESFFYLTFSRPIWAACWALLTFLCYYGHAPATNAFLAHRLWTPFARLTYGAYLCHPLCIKLTAGCLVQYYTFSGMDLTYRMMGNTLLAYSCSFVVWCVIERPMMTFTTALIKSKKGGKQQSEKKADQIQNEQAPNTAIPGK